MKKLYILAAFALAIMPVAAQDTYESARFLGNNLNGTARYVGMGGAMEALGADLSTISTNPAGIGLFRKSAASVSFGLVSQQDAKKFDGLNKTNMSFDQVGFVYAARSGRNSFVNFGFNYHKSRNFDQILSAANQLNGVSQNGLTYKKAEYGDVRKGGYDLAFNNQDDVMGFENATSDWRAQTYSQADYLNANSLLLDPEDHKFYVIDANEYNFDRSHRGWINEYDFNISGNVNDRFYWGVTFGLYDVNYKGYSEYAEGLVDKNGDAGLVVVGDQRRVKGSGFDMKAGIIFRPVEGSPFRIGLSVSTPTWYDLTTENATEMANKSKYGAWDKGNSSESYDFKLYTPWKFGLSLGHTVGNYLALGASYEYSDMAACQNRVIDGYDYYGYEDTYTDEVMKDNTEKSLKGVSSFKLGLEYKPDPALAVRFGYNYVTATYNEDGSRNMMLDSPGVMYSSTTDYTNWGGTNRITCGLGYNIGQLNLDVAYQYSATNGTFYAFQDYNSNGRGMGATDVSNKRHQVLFTIGYRF